MVLSLILFHIFINHLEDEQNGTLIKSADGAKQRDISESTVGKVQYRKTGFKRRQSKTLMMLFCAIKAQNTPKVEYEMLLKALNKVIENN